MTLGVSAVRKPDNVLRYQGYKQTSRLKRIMVMQQLMTGRHKLVQIARQRRVIF